MVPAQILDRFLERCPAVVMVRATLERLFWPERLDQIFEDVRQRQYSKQLLISQVVAVMMAVATRVHASVHAANLDGKDRLGVSPAALYDKLNHLEVTTSQALVRETASDAAKVIDAMLPPQSRFCRGSRTFTSMAIIGRLPNTVWRPSAARAKGRCRGSCWRFGMRSGV